MIDIIRPFNGFDYTAPIDPTYDVNPNFAGMRWLNMASGEIFICVSNAHNDNIWQGQLGTFVFKEIPLLLNGSSDYVDFGAPAAFNVGNPLTIEARIKLSAYPSVAGPIFVGGTSGGNARNSFSVNSSGLLAFDCYPPSGSYMTSSAAVPLNEVVHVAIATGSSTRKMYINGELVGSDSSAETYSGAAIENWTIGWRPGTGGEFFGGKLSELRYWNVERTQSQIQANLWKNLASGDNSGLVAYCKFREGEGATLIDSVAGNNGTLEGPTWSNY